MLDEIERWIQKTHKMGPPRSIWRKYGRQKSVVYRLFCVLLFWYYLLAANTPRHLQQTDHDLIQLAWRSPCDPSSSWMELISETARQRALGRCWMPLDAWQNGFLSLQTAGVSMSDSQWPIGLQLTATKQVGRHPAFWWLWKQRKCDRVDSLEQRGHFCRRHSACRAREGAGAIQFTFDLWPNLWQPGGRDLSVRWAPKVGAPLCEECTLMDSHGK